MGVFPCADHQVCYQCIRLYKPQALKPHMKTHAGEKHNECAMHLHYDSIYLLRGGVVLPSVLFMEDGLLVMQLLVPLLPCAVQLLMQLEQFVHLVVDLIAKAEIVLCTDSL